jgi:hypothetical protein
MDTTQPWQVFVWAAVRFGELYMYINSVNLTHEGISIEVYIKSKSWRRKWNKDEAVDLVASYFRRGGGCLCSPCGLEMRMSSEEVFYVESMSW